VGCSSDAEIDVLASTSEPVAAAKTGWELVEEKCTVAHPLKTFDET